MTDNILQEWTLTSENGGNIQLTFLSFDLEECSDYDDYYYEYTDECTCVYDYVEVSYGSYSEKFCGDTVPEVITSCGSSMVIKFHSDGATTGAGFRAEWEELATATPCSSNRDNTNIYTPDLGKVEASFTNCTIHTMYLLILLLLQGWTLAPENGGEF